MLPIHHKVKHELHVKACTTIDEWGRPIISCTVKEEVQQYESFNDEIGSSNRVKCIIRSRDASSKLVLYRQILALKQ
ncbi:hypothetical protein BLOT_014678, partial [Blomia tropicalis]